MNAVIQRIEYYKSRIRGIFCSFFPHVKVGSHTLIEPGSKIRCQYGGNIRIGNNCIIYRGGLLLTHGGNIEIGNNCTVNPYTVIYGQGGVIIGDNVRIAAHCTIIPSNHIFSDPHIPIYKQGLSKKGIVIEEDCWLGTGVKVLDGVTIARGCVIGANSVVTKSTEPNGVYVGAPAKRIKDRTYIK